MQHKKKKKVELHSSGDESAKNSRLYFRLDQFVRLNVTRQAKLRCCFIVLIAARRRSLSFCGMMMNCGSLMCVCVCYVHTHMQRNKGCMLYSPSSSPCVPPCRTINLSFQICPVSSPGFFPTSFSFSFLLQPVEDSWAVSCREKWSQMFGIFIFLHQKMTLLVLWDQQSKQKDEVWLFPFSALC